MHAFPVTARKILTTLVLCAPALTAGAQSGFVERMDGILAARRERMAAKYDTAYIRLPEKKWAWRNCAQPCRAPTSTPRANSRACLIRSMPKTEHQRDRGRKHKLPRPYARFLCQPRQTLRQEQGQHLCFQLLRQPHGHRPLLLLGQHFHRSKAEYGGENHDVGAGNAKMKSRRGQRRHPTRSTAAGSRSRRFSRGRRSSGAAAAHGLPRCLPSEGSSPRATAPSPALRARNFPC